jgi:hypothetical protein
MTSSRSFLGAATVAAALAVIGPATAGAAWAPPVKLYQGVYEQPAGVAIAPDGTVTTAVVRYGNGYYNESIHNVEVRTKPPGGEFGPPVTLTTSAETEARLVGDREGNVAVVWTQKVGGVRALRGAMRPAGGTFGPVRAISDAGSESYYWDVDMAGGKVIVSWMQNQRLRAASAAVGGAFEVADPLTGPISWTGAPQVAMAPSGAAIVAWASPKPDSGFFLQAMARPAGGTFAKLSDIAVVPKHGINYYASMSDEGRATVAWSYLDVPSTDVSKNKWIIQSASRGKTGDFGGVETVDTVASPGYSGGALGLETSPDGTSLLNWSDPSTKKVHYAIRPDGGGFGPTQTVLDGVGLSHEPLIVFGDDAAAHAVWDSSHQLRSSVQIARIPMDGSAARAETIGMPHPHPGIIETFSEPGLGVDSAGNVALAWTRGTDTDPGPAYTPTPAHEIRIFDTTPPKITGVNVPETALTDVPVPMSVTAFDSLTPVKIRWRISKFVVLQGPAIAPTYPAPGPSGVSIEVTDAVGHTTYASRTFQINQNPSPPPIEMPCPQGQICS